jgi:transposase
VPQNHLLRQLNQVDWERFTRRLLRLYKGGEVVGRPPFEPAMVLKMELLAYLYQLTERRVEVYVNEKMLAKYFVGLDADQSAPDQSTLTVFRQRWAKRGRQKVFEESLQEIVQVAMQSGIRFGAIQIVDSVNSIANVNTDKDQHRQGKGKGPRDPDARWGVKHNRNVKNEAGKEEK